MSKLCLHAVRFADIDAHMLYRFIGWAQILSFTLTTICTQNCATVPCLCVCVCVCIETGKMNGQISQIPGLSPVVIIPPEEKTQRRRGIVKESDSEYIKLAKQGGHKGRASIYTTPYITWSKSFCPHWLMFFAAPVVDRTFVARGHSYSQCHPIQTPRLVHTYASHRQ